MTAEELINSGNLELYLLGELSEEESKQVESMSRQYPEVKDELNSIESSLLFMANRSAIRPRAALKEVILKSINPSEVSEYKLSQYKTPLKFQYLVAASITLFFISSYFAITYYIKANDLSQKLLASQSQYELIQKENNEIMQRLTDNQMVTDVAANIDFMKVGLSGTNQQVTSSGVAYWHQSKGELYFMINNPPQIESNQDLQLWAIIEGVPVDVGVIKLNNSLLIPMQSAIGASAFAVTIEPLGGSKNPTLKNLILSGQVSL